MKITTWNVNSIRTRMPNILEWLQSTPSDIIALQETKVNDPDFPKEPLEEAGYHVSFSGQMRYNGVATLSREAPTDIVTSFPTFDDEQKRVLATTHGDLRVINVYVPNGSSVGSDKYQYKLTWLEHLYSMIKQELTKYPRLVVLGDFNIAPADLDVHDPKAWEGSVLVSPPEREALEKLVSLGLTDSFRELYPESDEYSWWDYRAAGFRRNRGLRIDHLLMSSELMATCKEVIIDKFARAQEKPSDHAPVTAAID